MFEERPGVGGGDAPDQGPVVPAGPKAVVPVEFGALGDRELAARCLEIERARTRLDAEQAVVLAELEARKTCDREFQLRTASWLAHNAGLPAGVARQRVKVATKLRRLLPEVLAALDAGQIGWDHARVLADLANPRIAAEVADNQEMLLGLADRCAFGRWQGEVRGFGRLWDQDGGYDPSEDPASNRLSFGTTLDGLTSLAATLTGRRRRWSPRRSRPRPTSCTCGPCATSRRAPSSSSRRGPPCGPWRCTT